MQIALDAMGGDHAPGPIVAGALQAAQADADLHVILVGDKAQVEPCLPDGKLPPHIATITFWIRDWNAYETAMAARAPQLIAEVPLFSKQQPSFQIDELVYEYEG